MLIALSYFGGAISFIFNNEVLDNHLNSEHFLFVCV